MRTALILCPGPSLASHKAGALPDYDVSIAVNRAIEFDLGKPADYWCFGDDECIVGFPSGRPAFEPAHPPAALFTCRCHISIPRPGMYEDESAWFEAMPKTNWYTTERDPHKVQYSDTAALYLAKYLACGEVHIFGVDHAGEQDFKGRGSKRRDERRWNRNIEHWNRVVAECEAAGMKMTRHGVAHARVST